MAKFLAFDRTNSQVVQLDTISGARTSVGPSIATVETTSLFPLRSQNLCEEFLSDAYSFTTRSTDGTLLVHAYDGVSWVPRFQTAVPAGAAELKPLGLHVANDRLVAVWLEVLGGTPSVHAVESLDGSTFSAVSTLAAAGLTIGGGHTINWKGSIMITTELGITYYEPGSGFTFAGFYTGDDFTVPGTGLQQTATTAGCFARWQTNLYFVQPATPTPKLYKLRSDFDPSVGPAGPQFELQTITGLQDPGALTIAPDGGFYTLFVTPQNELSMIYSGANGSFYAKTTISSFPVFQDQSSPNFPTEISSLVDAGFSALVDDRRLTRPVPIIMVKDTATGDFRLLDVQQTNSEVKALITTIGNDLILPQTQRSSKVFLDDEPAIFINSVTQLFPGAYAISYDLIDASSRTMDILPEYTIDGVTWLSMTKGDGGEEKTQLTSSPAGITHVFNWDARQDLNGTIPFQNFRIVARIGSA